MERYLKETKMLNYSAREIVALVRSRKWNDLDEYDKIGEIYRFVIALCKTKSCSAITSLTI